MSKVDDGGPAFPRPASENTEQGTLPDGNRPEQAQSGMSLRMYIAIQAMQGELACQSDDSPWIEFDKLAARSFKIADAMIAESKK